MRRGFSLLEVLISMGLLAVAITIGMSAFGLVVAGSANTSDNTAAVAVAENLVSLEVNSVMQAPNTVFNQTATALPAAPNGTTVVNGITYTYAVALSDVEMDTANTGALTFHNAATDNTVTGTRLKRVDATVTWTPAGQSGDTANPTRQLTLTRMLWVNLK